MGLPILQSPYVTSCRKTNLLIFPYRSETKVCDYFSTNSQCLSQLICGAEHHERFAVMHHVVNAVLQFMYDGPPQVMVKTNAKLTPTKPEIVLDVVYAG